MQKQDGMGATVAFAADLLPLLTDSFMFLLKSLHLTEVAIAFQQL